MYFLIEKINETEVYEKAEKVSLAGGEGSKIIEQFEFQKSLQEFDQLEYDEDELLNLTMELQKEV